MINNDITVFCSFRIYYVNMLCYPTNMYMLAWRPVTNIKYCMHIHHKNNPNNTKRIYINDWEMGQTSNNLWPSMQNYQDLAKKEIVFCKDHDLPTDFQNLKKYVSNHTTNYYLRSEFLWFDQTTPSPFHDPNRLYIAWTTELSKEIFRLVRHYGN